MPFSPCLSFDRSISHMCESGKKKEDHDREPRWKQQHAEFRQRHGLPSRSFIPAAAGQGLTQRESDGPSRAMAFGSGRQSIAAVGRTPCSCMPMLHHIVQDCHRFCQRFVSHAHGQAGYEFHGAQGPVHPQGVQHQHD